MSRTVEILGNVDALIREWDRWSEDPVSQFIENSSPLDDALTIAIDSCRVGDVPSQCRELVDAVSRLALEFDKYAQDECVAQTGEPLPKFYAAYQSVLRARNGAEPFVPRQIESVSELRRQTLNDVQIARIYGYMNESGIWVGPFFGRRGEVLVDQIALELKEPGKVIPPGWIHPEDVAEDNKRKANLESRMNRLTARAEEDKPPKFSEEDVVRYLKEGAYPAQAARTFRLRMDEVIDIANRHGINVGSPESTLIQVGTYQAGPEHAVESMNAEAITARILSLKEEGMANGDIVKTLKQETRQDISIQKVVKILGEQAKQSTSA